MRRGLAASGTTLNVPIFKSLESQKEKNNSKKWKTYLKNNGEHPQTAKENRLLGSPGSSESPKEFGPKEAHTKAHHNYITKDER